MSERRYTDEELARANNDFELRRVFLIPEEK